MIGKTPRLGQLSFAIIGVMPPSMAFVQRNVDLWSVSAPDQEIASTLADERRIQAVLYLCPNYETLRAISHVFVRALKTVIVAMLDDFVENPIDGRVLVKLGMTTLRTELRRISRQTASGQNRTKIG